MKLHTTLYALSSHPMSFKREDFPMCQSNLVYFDSAATALKPHTVIDAMSHFYNNAYATVHRGVYRASQEATERYMAVRSRVQTFLNAASPAEIVFTKGTTDGLNLLAHCCGAAFLQPGDTVLISGQEHHSNIVPWQLLSKTRGIHLNIIPLLPDGQLDLDAFYRLLTPTVKLISLVHASNVLGILNPIDAIIKAAHANGALVILDAAQTAPHLPLDVKQLDCDFLLFSGHKLYGPTGIGILYGKHHLLAQLPPYQGGGDMIQTVTFENSSFQAPPLRFEAGTPPIAEVIGLGAALEYVSARPNTAPYEASLIQRIITSLPSTAHILGPLHESRTSLVTFHIPGIHPLDLATLLDAENIAVRSGHLCAQPLLHHFGLDHALRVSIAPYNTPQEVERFSEALHRSLKKLG